MPVPDKDTIRRHAEIAAAQRRIVPSEGVVETPIEMRAFETDGLTAYRHKPPVVVLPKTTSQVSEIVKYAYDNAIVRRKPLRQTG